MSSNFLYRCEYCEKEVQDILKRIYGKVSEEAYNNIKNAKTVSELLTNLPESEKEWVNGDVGRIDDCELDYEFFESWGEGIFVNEEGNMVISVSGSCDLCGNEFHYNIKLPPGEKTIDLTKKEEKSKC